MSGKAINLTAQWIYKPLCGVQPLKEDKRV